MADTTPVRIELTLPKTKLRKLKKFLTDEGGTIVQNKLKSTTELEDTISKGSYQTNEKPSDFAGIWKDDDRDIDDMRRKAWDNRGIKW